MTACCPDHGATARTDGSCMVRGCPHGQRSVAAAAAGSQTVAATTPQAKHSGLVIHIDQRSPAQADREAVEAAIRRDPCSVLGHRAAYLARGGIACGVCGVPL